MSVSLPRNVCSLYLAGGTCQVRGCGGKERSRQASTWATAWFPTASWERCENWFSKKLGSKAEDPKKDQPASDWRHWTTYSPCHLLRSFPAQPFPCWGAAFSLLQVSYMTRRSHFWEDPNSAGIAPKHKCSCSAWDAAKDPQKAVSRQTRLLGEFDPLCSGAG